jgi:branched-chain amino acid transport system permease protein
MGDAIVSIVVSGVILGALYSLIASGLSLIWSTLGAFNFSHGVLMTLGAYVTWTMADAWGLPMAAAVPATVVVIAVVGLAVERTLFRPFISRPDGPMLVMVATLVATSMLQNVVQLAWGPRLKQLPRLTEAQVSVGDTVISGNQLVAIFLAPVLVGTLFFVLTRTRVGSMVRGVEQNRELALLMGIRPTVVHAGVVATAAMLATMAGVLLGGIQFMSPTMGDDPLIRGFMILVFGGAASLKGTLVGAYAIGFIEATASYSFGLLWSPVVLIGLIFVIMLVRPEGLIKAGARQ